MYDFKRLSSVEVPLTAKNLFGDDLERSKKIYQDGGKYQQNRQQDVDERKLTPGSALHKLWHLQDLYFSSKYD